MSSYGYVLWTHLLCSVWLLETTHGGNEFMGVTVVVVGRYGVKSSTLIAWRVYLGEGFEKVCERWTIADL